jgi:hypothetical protein
MNVVNVFRLLNEMVISMNFKPYLRSPIQLAALKFSIFVRGTNFFGFASCNLLLREAHPNKKKPADSKKAKRSSLKDKDDLE